MSLDIDLAPLWTSIQDNFPMFFGILVIPAGIGIAIALANFLIEKVRDAFK
jgi:hypothetical protein